MIKDNEFWEFMHERERIRLRRLAGAPRAEWTEDWILRSYSFTNVKREHDRTTTLLKREFYDNYADALPDVILLNAMLFRYFGTINFARVIGWHDAFGKEEQANLIRTAALQMAVGNKIFTPAYIVPNCGSSKPKHEVVAEIVAEVWEDASHIIDTSSWQNACGRLTTHYGVGSFMAKEVLLDFILASGWIPDDWDTWTPVGPGGRLGAGVVLMGYLDRLSEPTALEVIRALYAQHRERWKHDVALDLTDIQFQLCEFAKYTKAKDGVGSPKRKFYPTHDDITGAI